MMEPTFGFTYPWVLAALLLIPALLVWLLLSQKRYWRDALALSRVALLRELKRQGHPLLQQRMVPLLLLVALTLGIVGLAQPYWRSMMMTEKTQMMLTLDISISMEADDIQPDRLTAAKQAAIDFVGGLPQDVRLGLQFFAGSNYIVSPPTTEHERIIAYLNSLERDDLRPGTAVGDAIQIGVNALRDAAMQVPRESEEEPGAKGAESLGSIILLTDGESNLGIPPAIAANEAVQEGIRVFTVGIGEQTGTYIRGGIFTHLDEPTLQAVAAQTGGEYYRARSFEDFKSIYARIREKSLGLEWVTLSLTPWCLAGSLLGVLAAFGWMVHYRRY